MGSGLDTLNGSYRFPQGLGIYARGGGRLHENSKSDTHMNSQRLWEHAQYLHSSHRQNPSTEKAKHMVQLLSKSLFAIDNCWEREKSAFPTERHWVYQNTPGKVACSGTVGQYKMNFMFLFLILWVFFFWLFVCLSVCLSQRKNIKFGGWVDWMGIWERIWYD